MELLVAIAVIGILISLLIPAVGKVMESARRAKGANNVKQIALAYNQYAFDDVNGRTIPYGDYGLTGNEEEGIAPGAYYNNDWAIMLARHGYLNDPSVYCFPGDSLASNVVEKSIATEATATATSAWGAGRNFAAWSVCVATDVPSDAPLSTTPVVCTRGIEFTTNGTWDSELGVYKDKGGYIGFLDGHVEWFDNLGSTKETGNLVHYYTRKPTNDIKEALPSTCIWHGGYMRSDPQGRPVIQMTTDQCTAEPES